LIKNASYYRRFQLKEKFFLNKYLQETEDINESLYTAELTHFSDTTWTIDYFKGGLRTYSIEYSRFFPDKRHGKCTAYYENGEKRFDAIYSYEELDQLNTYYESGIAHAEKKFKTEDTFKYGLVDVVDYTFLNDENGQDLLEGNSPVELSYVDQANDRTIHQTFERNRLVHSYFLDNGDKIYQMSDSKFEFKMLRLQKKVSDFFYKKEYAQEEIDNVAGTVLIAVIIDEKRFASSYKILNSISDELQSKVEKFLDADFRSGVHKFFRYRIGREKVKYEYVFPLSFNVSRSYRKPANNFYYHDPFLHQQYYQPNLDHVKVPAFP